MRIVTLFLKYSIGLIIFGVVVGGLTREILLFWGTQTLKSAVNRAELIDRAGNDYERQCREKAGGGSGRGIKQVQVVFTSDTEYRVEVQCNFFSNDPILVETQVLPFQVKKAPGQSGFIWSEENVSGVVLEVFGRKTALILDGKRLVIKQGNPEIIGVQPDSTCKGFGFACCAPETQVGEGDQFPGVTDCTQECYPVCVSRPTVLRFTSDPNPSLENRTVALPKGAPITFYFVTDPGKAGQAVTTLQFGDGQSQDFSEKDTNVTHEYTCTQAQCQFVASLTMTDPNGQTSLPTTINTLTIVVQ